MRLTAPSGVQLQMTMRPSGRVTRFISPAVCSWSGANMWPKVESTRSKLSSAKGISWTSPSTQSTSTMASAARSRAVASRSGWESRPVTRAPARAAGIVALPVPQATSSTSMPGSRPERSTQTSPTSPMRSATEAKSPEPHFVRGSKAVDWKAYPAPNG